jgi:hypothetical protein
VSCEQGRSKGLRLVTSTDYYFSNGIILPGDNFHGTSYALAQNDGQFPTSVKAVAVSGHSQRSSIKQSRTNHGVTGGAYPRKLSTNKNERWGIETSMLCVTSAPSSFKDIAGSVDNVIAILQNPDD